GPRGHVAAYHGPTWSDLQAFWSQNWEWLAAIAAVLVVAGIVLFALGCIATGGIIRAAVEHDSGREYGLGRAWRAGYSSGWRIAGLKVLTFLLAVVPAFLLAALVVSAVAGANASMVGAAVGFGLSGVLVGLISIVFWIALAVAYQFAQRMVVLEDGRVAQSLSAGFRMIPSHFPQVAA